MRSSIERSLTYPTSGYSTPSQKAIIARSQVEEMYTRRVLAWTKRVQVLQPLYPKSSSESGHRIRRIRILVHSWLNSSKPIESLDIDFEEDDQLGLTLEESPISTGPHELPNDQSTSRSSPKMDKCLSRSKIPPPHSLSISPFLSFDLYYVAVII